jgi:hypothetical protein
MAKYYRPIVPKEADKELPVTPGQTFAVRSAIGYDIRDCKITKWEATILINNINEGEDFELPEGAIKKAEVDFRKFKYFKIWCEAWQAGVHAFEECMPIPMVVNTHLAMEDDNSPIIKSNIVPGGACGFAYVNIKPGTSGLSKWLVKEGYAYSDDYRKGSTINVNYKGSQSHAKKVAMANAMAKIFSKHFPELEINVYDRED